MGMKVNLSTHGITRKKTWVAELQRKFAEAHDLKPGLTVQSYISTPAGSKAFASWLQSCGFAARFWCIEPMVSYDTYGRKQTQHIGFGVEFDDKCPLLTEARLKA